MKIIIYTFKNCPYCDRAKAMLAANGMAFHEIVVDPNDQATRETLGQKSAMKTFPQIFFGDKLIGGFTELKKLDDEVGIKNAASE